jgi:hypothetical protein
VDLPLWLAQLADTLPPYVDRKTGAKIITDNLYPASYRTLEAWPLPTRRVNGKAIVPTRVLLEQAFAKFAAAPEVMGGRRTVAPTQPEASA